MKTKKIVRPFLSNVNVFFGLVTNLKIKQQSNHQNKGQSAVGFLVPAFICAVYNTS